MTDPKPLKAEMDRILRLPREQRDAEVLVGLVDAILASPRKLPPIPSLAVRRCEIIAERLRDPKHYSCDNESDAQMRLHQWQRWYALVGDALIVEGICILERLAARGWWNRFEAIAARVEAQVRALRELNLPWWPTHRIDEDPYRELTILDFVEQRLGRLNSESVRRGGGDGSFRTGGPSPARPSPAPRRDIDDIDLGSWQPSERLL